MSGEPQEVLGRDRPIRRGPEHGPSTIRSFADARAALAAGASPDEAARDLVAEMSPDERLWCLDGDVPSRAGLDALQDGAYHRTPWPAAVVERVGLPGVHFADGPRGAVVGNATAFPVTMARGATWDPDLEERVGDAIGRELRAVGATLTGAVCVNVLRHPAWGRAQETYGEDPHHVGEMGAALTRGLQRHVMACVKHLACNSMENARFTVDIEIDDVALHEVYLPHFRRVVDEGVAAVMSAYNSVEGEWAGQNRMLLTEVLREEWGFEGFVISDFIFGLRDASASLVAGLDVEMPFRMIRSQHLADALDRGDASWDDIDRSVARVIATLLRFDAVLSTPDPPLTVLGAPEHRDLARLVAARSCVLLRNEPVGHAPVLPLASESRVAVVGRLADRVQIGDGGSSDVWDLDCDTVLSGLAAALVDVVHHDGVDAGRAAAVARDADAAVVVVGLTLHDEGEYIGRTPTELRALFPPFDDAAEVERFDAWATTWPPSVTPPHLEGRDLGFSEGGDRDSLHLHAHDVELIRAVAAANPKTVVVIQAGSAVVMSEWIGEVPAVVQAWYGGSRAGAGLADVLLGVVNPSARLPLSIPVSEADLPPFDRDATSFRYDRWHGWWHLDRTGTPPGLPFGFGLSYTTFELGSPNVSVGDDAIDVEVAVHNRGDRAGADTVQVYAALPGDGPDRLVGFARVEVDAGATALARLSVPLDRLATRDPDAGAWRPPTGRHRVIVARHACDPDRSTTEVDLSPTDLS